MADVDYYGGRTFDRLFRIDLWELSADGSRFAGTTHAYGPDSAHVLASTELHAWVEGCLVIDTGEVRLQVFDATTGDEVCDSFRNMKAQRFLYSEWQERTEPHRRAMGVEVSE